MSKISVVIVSWNSRHFLIECLRSLLAQEGIAARDIIVVDNASNDGTLEAVREFDRNVAIIANTENVGFAKGNNMGILSSDSEYIALINPDVIVKQGCLAQLSLYLDEHPEVGLAGPKVLNSDGTLQLSYWPMPTIKSRLSRALAIKAYSTKEALHGENMDRPVGVLSGCFWMVRRSAIGEVGLLDEGFFMYAEDTDWCKRFWDAGWPVMYVPNASAIHYGGGASANTPVKCYIEMHRANLRFWRKHHGPLELLAVFLIMLLHQAVRIVGGAIVFLTSSSRRNSMSPVIRRSLSCLYYLCSGARPHNT